MMIAGIATCLILLSWLHNGIARQAGASSLRRGTSTNKSDKHQRVLAPSAWNQLGQTIVGEAKDDFAGNAVAINAEGTIIAIAARIADSPEQGINAGHVRIFEWDSNTAQWSQKGSNIDGEDEADRSGHQVSLNAAGDIVGISAQFNNNAGGPDSGHVRVYRFDDTRGEWVKLGRDLDGLSTSEWLESVSLSSTGLRVAIGASRHRVGSFYGQVRVYDYDSDAKSWVQVGSDVMGASVGDRLGSSVDLSDDGTIMAVGSYGVDCDATDANNNCGSVQVYKFDKSASDWVQVGQGILGASAGDNFGAEISLSGDGKILATGSVQYETFTGYARVYRYDSDAGEWLQSGGDVVGEAENDRSASSLSLSSDGTKLCIGAWGNDSPSGTNSGHVRVFSFQTDSDEWVQVGDDIAGEARGDGSGWATAINRDGTRVVIGSPDDARDDNSYKGSVRVFQFDEITLAHAAPPTSSPSASPSSSPAQESAISGTRTEDSNSPDTVIDTGMDPGGEKAGLVELEDYLVAIGDFFTNLSETIVGVQLSLADKISNAMGNLSP